MTDHQTTRREYEGHAAQMLLIAHTALKALAAFPGTAGEVAKGALSQMREVGCGR